MYITRPNETDDYGNPIAVFRRHRMTTANGRAVRPGFDYQCLTGYHRLHHGRHLQESDRQFFCNDIACAPIDAPDHIPAGSSSGHDGLRGDVRHANQTYIWRD